MQSPEKKAPPRPATANAQFPRHQSIKPVAASDGAMTALQFMLKLERDARLANSLGELAFLTVNSGRKLTNARQVFLLKLHSGKSPEVLAISSIASIDRNSPLVLAIERLAKKVATDTNNNGPKRFALPAYGTDHDPEIQAYPFGEMLWVPIVDQATKPHAALLFAKEGPWGGEDESPVTRLAEIYTHAWQFLTRHRPYDWKRLFDRRTLFAGAAVTALLAFVPVPMTALAPAEVVARAPAVVAAPIEGVIGEILVDPGARVHTGDILFRFNDTQARNAYEVAEREVQVAEAKLRQARQGAFVDTTYNREIAIAEADLAVKKSERDYSQDILGKSVVRAERDGLALFADKRDLIGRPVSVGQRIMEVADPKDVALRILVPVDEAAVLDSNASVRLFLDNDPLHPIWGHVVRASFAARANEGNQLSFRMDAAPDTKGSTPRLGLRGTAQVFGPPVPLAFYLFRRPLSYVRQKFGL